MMGNTYCGPSVNVTLSGIPDITHEGVILRFSEMNGSYSLPYLACGHFDPGRTERKRVHLLVEDGVWKVWFEYHPASVYEGEPTYYQMKFIINPSAFTPCDPTGSGSFDILVDYWSASTWPFLGWTPPLEGSAVVSLP